MTRVIFRMIGKENDMHGGPQVVALFPDIDEDPYPGRYCRIYLHIGQHGAANYGYIITESRPATEGEYKPLLDELVSIGYDDLKVYQKRAPWTLEVK